jgi:hypothetical protein
MRFSVHDLMDLRICRDAFVYKAAPAIIGIDPAPANAPKASAASSKDVALQEMTINSSSRTSSSSRSGIHAQLVAAGQRWSQHILEAPIAWILSLIHIIATVVAGFPLVYAIVHFVVLGAGGAPGSVVDTALGK